MNSGLPNGWCTSPLIELCKCIITGGRPKGGVRGITSGLLSLGGEHIHERGFIDISTPRFIPVTFAEALTNARILPNDILIVKDGATTGKTAIADERFGEMSAYVNEHVFLCRAEDDIESRYLFYFLWSLQGKQAILSDFRGAAQGGISRAFSDIVIVPVAPRQEQHRIVAKLDTLMATIHRAREGLERIPPLIYQYKQAILASSFSAWIQNAEPKELPLVELVDEERGIPYGIVQTGRPTSNGVPTVRAGDIKNWEIDKASLKLVDPEISAQYTRTVLRGGEALLSIRGTVGNAAVVEPNLAGCNISREVALIPVTSEVRPWYIVYFLSSPIAQNYLLGHVKGVAQSGINLRDLRKLPVPIVDGQMQENIVENLQNTMARLDSASNEVHVILRFLDHLEQAILAKAFRGELVDQDPNDEPASKLLERVRADRESREKDQKTHKGKRKKQ